MNTKAQVIEIARRRDATEAEVRFVLNAAQTSNDRGLLAVCLDCFRSVLVDSQQRVTFDVVRFLGRLLREPAYRRIRLRALMTALFIGRASYLILPEIMAIYGRPTQPSLLRPARWAAVSVAWDALAEGNAEERKAALKTFEQLRSLGLLNLRSFLKHVECDRAVRADVEALVARLKQRIANA